MKDKLTHNGVAQMIYVDYKSINIDDLDVDALKSDYYQKMLDEMAKDMFIEERDNKINNILNG